MSIPNVRSVKFEDVECQHPDDCSWCYPQHPRGICECPERPKDAKPKKYAVNGRPITLGEFYDGHGPDDPPGRYYTYDDQPNVSHWMPSRAMPIRMKEIKQ